ncbi:CoA transferase [Nocardia shimofusensis]|uniref:CoA transferase n=1 Tax=Nocardia shimofusensis TaxID=228596 RepID=UPI00082A3106|nr:CoA transferase [Nocardia shimofusensis]
MWTPGSCDPVRDWAESGIVALTGRAAGAPVVPPGRAASLARAHSAWIAEVTGGAVRVDGARLLCERAAFTGFRRAGSVSAGGACRLLRTADGWAAVSCARSDDPLLLAALACADLVDGDPWPAVSSWLAEHSGAELAERAELLGVAAWPVGPDREPAAPDRLGAPGGAVQRTPPNPRSVATAWQAGVSASLEPRPVAGLLVVDFSALWAGPLCAHLLGLAGARIVKVETPSRPDGARRGNTDFYGLLHGGHEAVQLDPTAPGDRAALAALVGAADIVIEASRPRALRGFGLDAARFVAEGATWLSITAGGRASNRVGFGDDVAAAAGLVAFDADGPMFVGDAIADPLTGLTAAALAMSVPRGGGGKLWDISMTDVVATTLDVTEGAAPQSYREGDCWMVESSTGAVEISGPQRRPARGPVAEPGRDTAALLSELGIVR